MPLREPLQYLSSNGRSFQPSAIRALSHLLNDPNVISFAGGAPSPNTFPVELVSRCVQRVLSERPHIALQYGPTLGLPRLRQFVASLCGEREIACAADQVLLTTGSQQALDLVASVLVDPEDVVLVELPSYVGGLASFIGRRATLAGVEQDDDGIVVEDLRRVCMKLREERRRPKLLYTIPNFQNPSGRLMSQARRAGVMEAASEFDFLIVEDDPYGELVYVDGVDTTPIKNLDIDERIIYLGSFSKILSPGLRCGWIVAQRDLLRKFEIAKEAADLCSGMLDQSIVDEICNSDELPSQIASVRSYYRDRRAVLLESLDEHFSGAARWTAATGGLFTFVTLLREVDTAVMIPDAVAAGVAYVPGAPFFVDGSGAQTMRLTFAKEPDDRMREGVARLARLFLSREHG